MSRIGLKHITLPAGVSVEIAGEVATVKGPKGSLQVRVPSVIKVENAGTSVLGNCTFHDRHQVNEGVIEEHTGSGDKPAGVIDQCDYVNAVLLPVFCL